MTQKTHQNASLVYLFFSFYPTLKVSEPFKVRDRPAGYLLARLHLHCSLTRFVSTYYSESMSNFLKSCMIFVRITLLLHKEGKKNRKRGTKLRPQVYLPKAVLGAHAKHMWGCLHQVFRPLKCWRWLSFGCLRAWWSVWCFSPREQWSSSTERPDSKWCWTDTWWPGWTGWSWSWCCSPEWFLGAPESMCTCHTSSWAYRFHDTGNSLLLGETGKAVWPFCTSKSSCLFIHLFF